MDKKNVMKIFTGSSDWKKIMMFLNNPAFKGTVLEIPLGINKDKDICITVKYTNLKYSAVSSIYIRKIEEDPDTILFTKEVDKSISFLTDPAKCIDGFENLIKENEKLICKTLRELSGEEWEIKF